MHSSLQATLRLPATLSFSGNFLSTDRNQLQRTMGRSKKQKTLNYNGDDIISNLPDVILSHILSFLPTKEAARTSLLSKRWVYLWTYMTRLEFHDESEYMPDAPMTEQQKFLGLVNRILRQQILTSSISSFTLWFTNSTVQYPLDDVNALISRVLELKVQKLSVKRINGGLIYTIRRIPGFPSAVFNSRSLIELDIKVCSYVRFPSSNCLTNLQVLRFGEIDLSGDCLSSSKELMLSFPILKVFEIDYCAFFDMDGVVIDTPKLESLVIRYPRFRKSANEQEVAFGTIKLFALHLRKFFYYGGLLRHTIHFNPSTVVDTLLDVRRVRVEGEDKEKVSVRACTFLEAFHQSLKFLDLGPNMIRTLAFFNDDLPRRLPIFESLVSLVLALRMYTLFDVLSNLLQKSPNLRRLELNLYRSTFGTSLSSSKEVPHCIQCNLKDVKIAVSEWNEDTYQFIKYMLENAQVLDRLTIGLKEGVRKVMKELLSIPKASSSVQIEVKRTTLKESEELRKRYRCVWYSLVGSC